jgi:predicted dehydrogenase
VPAINPYRASMANFLAAVRGEAEPLAGGADELHNLTAVAALERALQAGKVVTVRA